MAPPTTYHHHQPHITTINHISPPPTTHHHHQPHITTINHLSPPPTTYHHHQQLTTTSKHERNHRLTQQFGGEVERGWFLQEPQHHLPWLRGFCCQSHQVPRESVVVTLILWWWWWWWLECCGRGGLDAVVVAWMLSGNSKFGFD